MHAVEFSKTAAPCRRGFPPEDLALSRVWLSSGQSESSAPVAGSRPPGGPERFSVPRRRRVAASLRPSRARRNFCSRRPGRGGTGACPAAARARPAPRPARRAVGRQRLAVELHAALGELAPRLRARAPEELDDHLRADAASPPSAASATSSISVGQLVRDEHAVEAGLGLGGRLLALEARSRARARGRASRRAGPRPPDRRRRAAARTRTRAARPGSAASCRTSPPAGR